MGPIYEAKVKAFVEKNELTPENKQELMRIIKDFRVGDAEVREGGGTGRPQSSPCFHTHGMAWLAAQVRSIGVSLYKAKAESLFGEKKYFTEAELASLATLKDFLLLSEADVDRVHEPMAKEDFLRVVDEEFSKQAKAAAEGGAAPAMSESARQRIHDTAKRLGLSEDARDDLLGIALTRTLDPQLENLKTQYRRVTMTAEEKKEAGGKDEGEDPFIRGRTKEGLMIKTERNSNLMVSQSVSHPPSLLTHSVVLLIERQGSQAGRQAGMVGWGGRLRHPMCHVAVVCGMWQSGGCGEPGQVPGGQRRVPRDHAPPRRREPHDQARRPQVR